MPRNTALSMAYTARKKVDDSVDFDSNVHDGMTKCHIKNHSALKAIMKV